MQISELIKLAKSSSLRSGSGSRIIIKFDINNIRNRRAPLDPLRRTVCWLIKDGCRGRSSEMARGA